MTYSLIARCPRTGRLGIGTASYTIAVGRYTDGATRPNVGVTFTQGAPLHRNNRLAINSLAQGCTPQLALAALRENDEHYDYRQIAILDREGAGVAHTGSHVRASRGQRVGANFVAIGSMLASEKVLDAMVASFESSAQAEFDDRLLSALEAGRDAGGLKGSRGPLPERSVAIVVWHKQDYSEIDLRVDLQDGAIAVLRAMYADYKPTAEYYEERARHPRNALPAMEFADMLKKKQQGRMTYSIIARCPHTGRFGVGTTTFSLACGRRNESLRPNVGVSKSQAFYLRRVDPFVLNMLAQGHTPAHIAKVLEADDPDFEYRQFGIIDREANVFAHTGPKIGQWAGHIAGPYYAAYGNGLAGRETVEGIVAGFMSDPDAPLEERLMRGIEGGRDAGGQRFKGMNRPERSAWLRVVDRLDWPMIDLRVDMHEKTVAELRRIFEVWKRYGSYYDECSHDPRNAKLEEDVTGAV